MPDEPIKMRPHHLLCTLGFEGKGYDLKFVQNYTQIKNTLTENTLIEIVTGLDQICSACPNQIESLCKDQQKIQKLDQAHQTVLQIKSNTQWTWGQIKDLLKTKMSLENFEISCQDCQWKPLQICKKALTQLLSTKD